MKYKLKSHTPIEHLSIEGSLKLTNKKIELNFLLKGELEHYLFPQPKEQKRLDELWKESCFELFLAGDDKSYYELNFSPSFGWNFYLLNGYRGEPKELEVLNEPKMRYEKREDKFSIYFELESKNLNFEKFTHCNLATILLTKEKKRTFWAIEHLKDRADFHDRESFVKII
jgi:hypothetical protein